MTTHRKWIAGALVALASATACAAGGWQEVASQGLRHFVLVPAAASGDRAVLNDAARTLCKAKGACVVMYWSDARLVPTKMPLSKAQAQGVVAQYSRNSATGHEELHLR